MKESKTKILLRACLTLFLLFDTLISVIFIGAVVLEIYLGNLPNAGYYEFLLSLNVLSIAVIAVIIRYF